MIIAWIGNCPVPNTMALGGVATGIMKAQLAATAAGIASISGDSPWATASAPSNGRKAAAVAVLEVISVRKMITSTTTPIIAITGDGGFGQYLADFTTAVKYDMNITHVLLNNGELAKISEEQRGAEYAVWQTSLRNPDFAEYARSCGGYGRRVTDPADVAVAIAEALDHPGPAMVEIITDPGTH